MPKFKRRQILSWLGLATGAAIVPPVVSNQFRTTQTPSASSIPLEAKARSDQISKVALLKTSDRVSSVPKILDLLQPDHFRNKNVFIKPNYNTGDPVPAATDTDFLKRLVDELEQTNPGNITIGDRAGMADTRQAMQRKGVFDLAQQKGLDVIVFDEMAAEQWQYFDPQGTHWEKGFAVARPILEADAVINTCCLKTHRFGGHFTLALKNTIGMVAKQVPGDGFDYMEHLHSSPHQRKMIAEVNAAYDPDLIVLDGVEAFVKGGPDQGQKVASNVMIAGRDRIAVDVVGLAMLRHLGTTPNVSQGSIWDLDQIQRAADLGLGAINAEQIEIVTGDRESENLADQLRSLMI